MSDLFSVSKPNTRASVREILLRVAGVEAVEDFMNMRRQMRKPLNDRAAKMIAAKLDGNMSADDVLNLSTLNCWAGVFPNSAQLNEGPNGQRNHSQNGATKPDTTSDAINAAATIRRPSTGTVF